MRLARLAVSALLGLSLAGCGSPPEGSRLWSDTYEFRVTLDPKPPRALEPTVFRVVIVDKKTKQPIETGEGRIFATSADRANTSDGFKKEKELGTYSGRLFFATTGDWAAAIQFRREKNERMPLERVDWIQTVLPATEPGT